VSSEIRKSQRSGTFGGIPSLGTVRSKAWNESFHAGERPEKEYTKSSRYDAHNYDLVLSADGKTEDQIVELIMKFIG